MASVYTLRSSFSLEEDVTEAILLLVLMFTALSFVIVKGLTEKKKNDDAD